jgi:hypothetical protein
MLHLRTRRWRLTDEHPQIIFCLTARVGNTEDCRKSCDATTRAPGVKAVAPARSRMFHF